MTITAEQIPDEIVEAAAKAGYEVWRHDCAGELELDLEMYRLWDQLEPDEQERWCAQFHAAIAAALNAWPGASISYRPHWRGRDQEVALVECLILPLPQEGRS